MKLGLGTVEFAAKTGRHALRVPVEEAQVILRRAADAGIRVLDTAAQAGNSEEVLGECLWEGHPFQIVTRAPSFEVELVTPYHADQLEHALLQTLARLKQPRVDALMMSAGDGLFLPGGERLVQRMEALREQGLVGRIGISVSDEAELVRMLDRLSPQIVQLPVNVLDQRLWRSGALAQLKSRQIEIQARDVFLQGVLLDPTHLHPWFWPLRKQMEGYHDFLIAEGLTPLEGGLSFVAAIPEVDVVLIGVQSLEQLEEMLGAGVSVDPAVYSSFFCSDLRFVDPRQWNLYE